MVDADNDHAHRHYNCCHPSCDDVLSHDNKCPKGFDLCLPYTHVDTTDTLMSFLHPIRERNARKKPTRYPSALPEHTVRQLRDLQPRRRRVLPALRLALALALVLRLRGLTTNALEPVDLFEHHLRLLASVPLLSLTKRIGNDGNRERFECNICGLR